MTRTTILEPVEAAAPACTAGPVLVALKPFDGGDSAVTMARWLAERRHVALEAVSVIEMGDMGMAVAGLPPLPEEYYQRERDELAANLHERVMMPGAEGTPRVDVLEGAPGSTLAGTAAERRASAIVIGTGQHGMLGRFLYGERALEVVRNAQGPVLVVPPYVEPPIMRAIVAVDFSEASVRAARTALEMLDPGGRLTLVHVEHATRHLESRSHRTVDDDERRTRARFSRFLDALPGSRGVQVGSVILRGDAVGALLRYAEEQEVDLIACGRRRHSLAGRLLVGSVSTALIRGAPCCVLVAPDRPEDDDVGTRFAGGEERTSIGPAEWHCVQDVSARNVGRRARLSLEASTPGGVESVDRGYLLLALDYDRRGERADIILGDPQVAGSHLSRRITGIRRIETVTNPDGRDAHVDFITRSGRCLLEFVGA